MCQLAHPHCLALWAAEDQGVAGSSTLLEKLFARPSAGAWRYVADRLEVAAVGSSEIISMIGPTLPANVITVTPHAILKRVQPTWAVLNDAGLCEVVDDL